MKNKQLNLTATGTVIALIITALCGLELIK